MKQIGLSRMMYVQDYDSTFPANRFYMPNGYYTWRAAMMSYIKSESVWLCPSAPSAHNAYDWPDTGCMQDGSMTIADYNNHYKHCEMNYADNGNLFDPGSVNQASITCPATTIDVIETRDYWPDLGTWTFGWNYQPGSGGSLPFWHNTGGNYTFADGHAKWSKLAATIAPVFMWEPNNNANNWSNWGGDNCAAGNNNGLAFTNCLQNELPPAYR
jgi:prepilin-type processing-associated H-X9-DG protein